MKEPPTTDHSSIADNGLSQFDHVVVLMLENRSLDNLLGYLYPQGVPANAPLGKTFDGVLNPDGSAKPLFNPIPGDAVNKPDHGLEIVAVAPVPPGEFNQPFPDPGEEYAYINTQLWNRIDGGPKTAPYNLPPGDPLPPPTMDGFVTDYIRNFKEIESPGMDPNGKGRDPTVDEYAQIMHCYTPEHLPVISTLAREFAVFDHWHCAVPSQTLCNRAFWHAGTSWGLVVNDPTDVWKDNSDAPTIFNQITESGTALNWRIYSDNSEFYCLTQLLHAKALAPFAGGDYFKSLEAFEADCAGGTLPSYSFLEPRFVNPHNDMHPSSTTGQIDGNSPASSMTMGELLVWRVYEAVRTSPLAERTLLIITFDEAGGTYDHVPPPAAVPPDLGGIAPQDGFDYTRLGIRVPTIMISAQIARNTVVNAQMDHNSFINTVRRKWEAIAPGKFPPLSARVAASPDFSAVFTTPEPRPVSDWPVIPKPIVTIPPHDPDAPMNALQKSCAAAVASLKADGHPAFV